MTKVLVEACLKDTLRCHIEVLGNAIHLVQKLLLGHHHNSFLGKFLEIVLDFIGEFYTSKYFYVCDWLENFKMINTRSSLSSFGLF